MTRSLDRRRARPGPGRVCLGHHNRRTTAAPTSLRAPRQCGHLPGRGRCGAAGPRLRQRHHRGGVVQHGRQRPRPMAERSRRCWRTRGYLVLSYSFRYPMRTNRFTEAMARGTVPDLLGAIAYVRGLGATRVVLIGASLGGIAVGKVAGASGAAAVVVLASPQELLGVRPRRHTRGARRHHGSQALHRLRGGHQRSIRRHAVVLRERAGAQAVPLLHRRCPRCPPVRHRAG